MKILIFKIFICFWFISMNLKSVYFLMPFFLINSNTTQLISHLWNSFLLLLAMLFYNLKLPSACLSICPQEMVYLWAFLFKDIVLLVFTIASLYFQISKCPFVHPSVLPSEMFWWKCNDFSAQIKIISEIFGENSSNKFTSKVSLYLDLTA